MVERFFNKLKQFRAEATRYDKRDDSFLASVQLAAIRIWIKANESVAYGIDVSPDLIATVTDAVLKEITAWAAAGCRLPAGVLLAQDRAYVYPSLSVVSLASVSAWPLATQ